MSFSAYARRVRDPGLPYRRRVSALRSCVQLYRPIGFHATLSFLEELAGPYQRDEDALHRALDALAASRARRRAEADRYAQARRTAKHHGQRSPRRDDPHPAERPGYWYGAPRQAALHALGYWRRIRLPALLATVDPVAGQVDSCVRACLDAEGALTPQHRQLLVAARQALDERLRRTDLYRADTMAYFRTLDLIRLTRYVEIAADATRQSDVPSPR